MRKKQPGIGRIGALLTMGLLLGLVDPAGAVEIHYQSQPELKVHKRRLPADPDRPQKAPTALEIEYTAVTESAGAAETVASRALMASRKAYGANSPRTIGALINRAYTRQRAGADEAAVADFESAIALGNNLPAYRQSQRFEAYYGLGVTQLARGDVAAANSAFDNALRVYPAAQGPAADRLDVLDALALTQRQMGARNAPTELQLERIKLADDSFEPTSDDYVRTYTTAGRYFRAVGEPESAVSLHRVAIRSSERAHGAQSPELISPLLDLALSIGRNVYVVGKSPNRTLEQDAAIERALSLTEQRTDVSAAERAKGLAFVGDVDWLIARPKDALKAYRRAEEALAKVPSGADKPSLFDLPAFLVFDPPRLRPGIPRQPGATVTAHFDVDQYGRVHNAMIVTATDPYYEAVLGQALQRSLRVAVLRPQLLDGEPIATADVTYQLPVD